MDQLFQNTDREIWREVPDDYYSPSIHVTQRGDIGISVGGMVFVRPVREWHDLAKLTNNDENGHFFMGLSCNWCGISIANRDKKKCEDYRKEMRRS